MNLRDLHEHISIGVLQYHIAYHHLHLLNGLTPTHTKVTNVSQKPKEEIRMQKHQSLFLSLFPSSPLPISLSLSRAFSLQFSSIIHTWYIKLISLLCYYTTY